MRVLAVTNLFPNPLQPERAPFNLQQLRSLSALHEVRVIAPIAWTGEWMAQERGRLPHDRRVVRNGMVVDHPRYLFTPRVLRGIYGHFFMRSVAASFDVAMREFQPDVALGCWAYPDGWATVRLARRAGIPVLVKVHGSDLLTAARGSVRERRAAEALCDADGVLAVSEDLRFRIEALGVQPTKIRVVRNGVDTELFTPGNRGDARRALGIADDLPLVLFVGNLVKVKGPDLLIAALARIAARVPDIRCALVGAGPLESRLRALASELNLADRVRFVGSRPLAELPLWYRAADCLALPSRSEGIPNVLLEATACGTPWIATRVGGVPEIAAPESLVPPEDPEALAFAVHQLLGDNRREVPGASRSISWRESAAGLSSALQAIVDRRAVDRLRAA